MKIKVLRVNAFTDSEKGGNPAGVLVDSPDLTVKQMAYITKQLKVSETAFVFPSDKADYKVLFYTPTIEVELCGHATIATFYTMASRGLISKKCVTQETKAGILPVEIRYSSKGSIERVMMTQGKSILKDISLDISNIARLLNISTDDIDTALPCQAVSTGLFTLPICVKSFDILKNMKPDFEKIKKICEKNTFGSFHVFTFETKEPDSAYHARNFAPVYGVNEDPVTGTANGAVCGYLLKNGIIEGDTFVCEQGDIIGRPGRVHVNITDNAVKVGGIAKIVEEVEMDIK
jgi:PhzF family phenazine biosynthesis protein